MLFIRTYNIISTTCSAELICTTEHLLFTVKADLQASDNRATFWPWSKRQHIYSYAADMEPALTRQVIFEPDQDGESDAVMRRKLKDETTCQTVIDAGTDGDSLNMPQEATVAPLCDENLNRPCATRLWTLFKRRQWRRHAADAGTHLVTVTH
jgi:hypothetical protein